MSIITITKENFTQEVLNADTKVLLDFWAPWCGPCKMLSPIIEEIAQETSGKVKVGKVNIDEQPALADQFAVMSIPTLLLFENGKIKTSSVGVIPKEQILSLLQQ
jgi:thioredoxin 1